MKEGMDEKKVCWHYLKGDCHFGNRCKFRHINY